MKCLFFGALVVIPIIAGTASAQPRQYYSSMEPYRARVQQGGIAARVGELLLAYRALDAEFAAADRKLDELANDPYTASLFVNPDGPFARRRQFLAHAIASPGGLVLTAQPGLPGTAAFYITALESIDARTRAGERWDPDSSARFLNEAQTNLRQMQVHLYYAHRHAEAFRRRVTLSAPTTYIRIDGRNPPYRH